MKFDDFLEWHQKLILKNDEAKCRLFVDYSNICIDQMNHIFLVLKQNAQEWDGKINRLIQLRDQMIKILEELKSKEVYRNE